MNFSCYFKLFSISVKHLFRCQRNQSYCKLYFYRPHKAFQLFPEAPFKWRKVVPAASTSASCVYLRKTLTLLLACEQALLFGRAKRAARERASERRSVLARLASLAQIGELARRLPFCPSKHGARACSDCLKQHSHMLWFSRLDRLDSAGRTKVLYEEKLAQLRECPTIEKGYPARLVTLLAKPTFCSSC